MKNYSYIFVYVCCDKYDMKSFWNEYLRLLGGQLSSIWTSHYSIYYMLQKRFFDCSKKAIYCCSEDTCNNFIFKKCFNECHSNNINFMAPNDKLNPNDSKEEDYDDVSNQSYIYSEIYKD